MSSKTFRISLAIVSGMVLVASGLYAVDAVVFAEDLDECLEQAETVRSEADSSGVVQIFSGSNAYDLGNYPALEGYSNNGAPVVWIANNPFFDALEEELYLLAYAWDVEDGWLEDSAFAWHSSLDGTVGADSKLTYRQKSPGCHLITVFATDSDGLVGVAKTVIRAGLPNTAPIAADDVVSSSLSERIFFDVVGNDFDLERNIDTSTLRIIDPPKIGQAEIINPKLREVNELGRSEYYYRYDTYQNDRVRIEFEDEGNIGLMWYEGKIFGMDSLVYEVCDIYLSCDTATIHIYSGINDCTIMGTDDDNTIIGTNEDDVICGFAGDDIIYGKNGDDIIYGGSGEDLIFAGYGDDSILGGSGGDTIFGGQGQDIINERNRSEISTQDDKVYHDFIDINDAFISLSEQEENYLDIVLSECNHNPSTFVRGQASLCGEVARNLCLSRIAIDISRQQSASKARLATIDFLCKAAHLAEKITLAHVLIDRYDIFYGYGYLDFFCRFS